MKVQGIGRDIPTHVVKFAQEMEGQFNRIMIDAMKKTVGDEQDMATRYYNSLLDEERALLLSKLDGGLGIARLIIDQLYPEQVQNQHAQTAYGRGQ